jgi:hypothetical protein
MSSRRVLSVLVLGGLALGAPCAPAQSFNLRDLLTDFLRAGITLAPPPAGFPSHQAHFIGENSPQFLALQQFNTELAVQLSSFPLPSSAGGFTYQFDPALGVLTRASDSFGPIYAERADTLGKGKVNLGINYSHFSFDHINDLSLRDGDVALVFTHIDINHDNTNLEPFFEGDVITAQLRLKIQTDITAFVMTYGVTDRFDVGLAVPIVRVDLEAQTNAQVQPLGSGTIAIHRFTNGTTADVFRQTGSASGIGDVVLRGKYRVLAGRLGGLAVGAEVRLPTGEERDLLGTGTAEVTGSVVGSLRLGTFSPHVNGGYTAATRRTLNIPDEIFYRGGFDWAFGPRVTLAADVLGRTFRNTQAVRVVQTTFEANTNRDPNTPPVIVTAELPRLVSEERNLNQLLGSIGVKVNPFGNFLLTVNGLFPLNHEGLQTRFAPLVGIDYAF